jgi:hypothetical protein
MATFLFFITALRLFSAAPALANAAEKKKAPSGFRRGLGLVGFAIP